MKKKPKPTPYLNFVKAVIYEWETETNAMLFATSPLAHFDQYRALEKLLIKLANEIDQIANATKEQP